MNKVNFTATDVVKLRDIDTESLGKIASDYTTWVNKVRVFSDKIIIGLGIVVIFCFFILTIGPEP